MRHDERTIHDVVQLDREGMSWRAIARALKISRNTVRQIMTTHKERRKGQHSAFPKRRHIRRPDSSPPP